MFALVILTAVQHVILGPLTSSKLPALARSAPILLIKQTHSEFLDFVPTLMLAQLVLAAPGLSMWFWGRTTHYSHTHHTLHLGQFYHCCKWGTFPRVCSPEGQYANLALTRMVLAAPGSQRVVLGALHQLQVAHHHGQR